MTASQRRPRRAARSPSRFPRRRSTAISGFGSDWPRLKTVTSWPRASAASAMCRPTNRVPPRMRIFTLCTPAGSSPPLPGSIVEEEKTLQPRNLFQRGRFYLRVLPVDGIGAAPVGSLALRQVLRRDEIVDRILLGRYKTRFDNHTFVAQSFEDFRRPAFHFLGPTEPLLLAVRFEPVLQQPGFRHLSPLGRQVGLRLYSVRCHANAAGRSRYRGTI